MKRFETEFEQTRTVTTKLQAETMKIQAEMMEVMEETRKISAERRWYPIASADVSAIIAALIVAFSKFAG